MEYFITLDSDIFPGFYNTYLDPSEIESETEITPEMFDKIKQDVCNYILGELQDNCPFHIVSATIWSPQTYNNANDTFDLIIETTPEAIMYEVLTSDYLEEICDGLYENYTNIFIDVLTSFISAIAAECIDEEELYSIVLANI